MITRMWKGSAFPERADDYVKHLEMLVLPELQQIKGFRGVKLLREETADSIYFVVLTFWESMDVIRQFAGEQIETAVVAPEARPMFLEYDSTVRHFEVVLDLMSSSP